MTKYDALKERLDEIKELSTGFPDNLQAVICKGLIDALNSEVGSDGGRLIGSTLGQQPRLLAPVQRIEASNAPADAILTTVSGVQEWPGVATYEPTSQKFVLAVRDWKAKAKTEQARRLVYVAIRASERFTGEESASSRDFITPLLKEHRLYDGNTRNVIAKDKGIQRNGDELRLDVPGKAEADRIIAEILSRD